ncbi:SDR family NAD(P)-dependent oxidoreductase [Parapusillimonas granuli]|uniref:SDR family oxidoreductase n=1 Tax=Parapusillimonas granuli TaxID=380911 RepID=A0A853G156_9BURK|nr:SDR family oxidoreductase [Parapusillimonas granuli]MBB5214182.1 NAD(P)-dependent dehydrogenase (short-subunit alcohol dehydrogenase family) [Parapusillimonas granuli]MEB2399009.1 SDR family NAD(P)-dependent oxidoreductase [Alcaligenaceae bacterium]NYT50603.1 SDR family oxidoreductase [Parapusillimonas granuli]
MTPTIVITGAASGVGFAAAASLLSKGWKVFALDRDETGLAKLRQASASAGSRLITKVCDVTSPDSVSRTFSDILPAGEPLNALLCSAGVIRIGPVAEMSIEDYDTQFNINTRGPWLCAKAALPALKRTATEQNPAHVIMISSISAIRPKVGSGVYAATKAALSQLTRVLAVECAADQVLVNAIAPSTINTPFISNIRSAGSRVGSFKLSGTSPLGRVTEPEDICAVIEFLLSDGARNITGVTLPVDGGTSAAFIGQSS